MYATVDEVSAWANDLSDRFLECRDMRHSWRRVSINVNADDTLKRVRRCRTCKTERSEIVTQMGHVLSRTYSYPDGYQTHGIGRMAGDTLDAVRAVSIQRELAQSGKDADVVPINKRKAAG